jgi:hypothetical protein
MAVPYSTRSIVAILALGGILSAASADGILVRRDTVVPIKFESDLTIKGTRTGQRFYATVDERGDLPFGARLEGAVVGVHEADGETFSFAPTAVGNHRVELWLDVAGRPLPWVLANPIYVE